jgi:hypothetical protein
MEITKEMKSLPNNPDGYWYAIGSRLEKIINSKLFRAGGYKSFSEYCQKCLGYSRQHAYKLMKVAQFIDRQWQQANNEEQREMVNRLFTLGFTKLHLLHTLPATTLDQLLTEGVYWTTNETHSAKMISLEAATLAELRRSLSDKLTGNVKKPLPYRPAGAGALYTLINSQAKNLLEFLGQNNNELINSGDFPSVLATVKEYALAIAQGVAFLSNNNVNVYVSSRASALVIASDDEQFSALQKLLISERINVRRARSIDEAKESNLSDCDLIILHPNSIAATNTTNMALSFKVANSSGIGGN